MTKSQKRTSRPVESTGAGSLKPAGESWQIQSAKARFSEVFRRARTEGPQRITGKEKKMW